MFNNIENNSSPINSNLSSESAVKNNKIDWVFETFKQFSQDPLNELYGRNYWCEKNPQQSLEHYYINNSQSKKRCEISPGCFGRIVGAADFKNTLCGVTYEGLMSALNGNTFREAGKLNVIERNNFNTLTDQIIQNGLKLTPEREQDFFSYGFSLDVVPMYCENGKSYYSGHEFVVIQYLNEKNELRYRFFQSFVNKYTLNEYLSNYKNDYSQEEFLDFLKKLKVFTATTEWTKEAENFQKEYFQTKGRRGEGWWLNGIPLDVKWQKNCVEGVITQKSHYDQFKKSPHFPLSFILIPDIST